MNSVKKIVYVGGAMVVSGVFLASFTNKKDEGKNKKYQIIHYADDEMIGYDTVVPMSSTYTPEQFAVDKGITIENIEIMNLPSPPAFKLDVKETSAAIQDLAINFNAFLDEIEVNTVIDDDGDKTTKTIVNGIVIELKDRIQDTESKGCKPRLIKLSFDDTEKGGDTDRIEISIEVDQDRNQTITKKRNGEHVEMSEEELANFDITEVMNHDNLSVYIEDDFGEGLEVELKKTKILLEGLIEGLEEGKKESKIFIRQTKTNSDDDIGELISENKENFTLVIVIENYNDETAKQPTILFNHSSKGINVYPNPNDGIFRIALNNDEAVKTNIVITDAKGKKVFEENLGKFSGKYDKEVNLKEFGSGTYTITIESGNNKEVNKVIVQ